MTEITYFMHRFGGRKEAEAYRYRNPDGSDGGIVAKSANIAEGVTIPPNALVWPDAKISLNVSIGYEA